MLEKREITTIFGVTLVLAIAISFLKSQIFLGVLLAVFLILVLNVVAKKIAAFYMGSEIEIRPWQMERYCRYLTWMHEADKDVFLKPHRQGTAFILEEQFEELMNPPAKDDGQDSQIYLIKVTKA